MAQAPKEECCFFLYGCNPITCSCAQYQLRYDVLNHIYPGSKLDHYICCQGLFGSCCCFKPGRMGEEKCPACCLSLEVVCCPGPAVSATRALMMEKYSLGLDPCDNQIVRFNNCLQGLLVFVKIVNLFGGNSRTEDCERNLRTIANIVYMTTQGCMLAQIHRELKKRGTTEAPTYQAIEDRE